MRHSSKSPTHFESLESRAYLSASVGVQVVGLSSVYPDPQHPAIHSDPNNAADLASYVVTSKAKNVQVECLPFEFTPQDAKKNPLSDPFANETTFIHDLLTSKWTGDLEIAVDVAWYPHGAGDADQDSFWAAWGASKPTKAQTDIRNYFLGRVDLIDAWVKTTRTWASQLGVGKELKFTVIPVLEDTDAATATGKKAFANIVSAIDAEEDLKLASRTLLRRSCLVEDAFRVSGVSLEIHGPWATVKKKLDDAHISFSTGDTWS
ncbi:MAG TPA: hypothetical protein VGN88_03410, partial [Phycisphaerae bacterium]